MQNSRRNFIKKGALVSAGVAAATTVGFAAKGAESTNGVVKGHSPKEEIVYKKNKAWADYYKQAL